MYHFPYKITLWRMFLFSPSGPTTTIHNSSQYLALMQLILKIISHKPGHLSFPILLEYMYDTIFPYKITLMEDVSIFSLCLRTYCTSTFAQNNIIRIACLPLALCIYARILHSTDPINAASRMRTGEGAW